MDTFSNLPYSPSNLKNDYSSTSRQWFPLDVIFVKINFVVFSFSQKKARMFAIFGV